MKRALRNRLEKDFTQKAICGELTDILFRKFNTGNVPTPDVSNWLEKHYDPAVETLFRSLYDHCFRYAMKLVGEVHAAQDIAQDSMRDLLNCTQTVQNLKAWLGRVAHNKAVALYKLRSQDEKLRHSLAESTLAIDADPDVEHLHTDLDPKLIKKLLCPGDHRMFLQLQKHKSLHDYAQTHKISYQTAKEHSHRIKHNLRAAYLKHCGYLDCMEILSYQQVRYLKGFIRKLKALSQPSRKPAIRDKRLLDAFGDSLGIMHWEVSRVDGDRVTVMVMILTSTLPTAIRVTLKQNRSRHVSVAEFTKLALVATIEKGNTNALYKDKGKAKLDKEKLLAIAPNATVYNEENFQKVLEMLRRDIERGR